VEHGSSAWALSQPCRHKRPLINIHDESPHRALIVQMLIYPPELGFDKKKEQTRRMSERSVLMVERADLEITTTGVLAPENGS
jgi:hypothetical protein